MAGRRKEAHASYQSSRRLLQQGPEHYEEAEQQLHAAVAAYPDQPQYLLALAECICHDRCDPQRSMQVCSRGSCRCVPRALGRCVTALNARAGGGVSWSVGNNEPDRPSRNVSAMIEMNDPQSSMQVHSRGLGQKGLQRG